MFAKGLKRRSRTSLFKIQETNPNIKSRVGTVQTATSFTSIWESPVSSVFLRARSIRSASIAGM